MMDLADEVHDMLDTMKLLVKENQNFGGSVSKGTPLQHRIYDTSDLIEVDSILFSDNETWLYKPLITNDKVQDLHTWLYQDNVLDLEFAKPFPLMQDFAQLESKKSIDSRTFTRPKKRLNRPSIEHYNEGYFKMDRKKLEKNSDVIESSSTSSATNTTAESSEVAEPNQVPLNFDYGQPTTSNIFDRIATNGLDIDSFQNMSPPSLINSMCSSTFTNLMENSYIKNDPLLREIRDADPTDAMLEDCELPVFKSFTDSCSSMCSDEQVLKEENENVTVTNSKESSLNDTFSAKDATVILNCTYQKDSGSDIDNTFICDNLENEKDEKSTEDFLEENSPPLIINGTFRKSSNTKLNSTFSKSFENDELLNDNLNHTVTLDCTPTNCLNKIKRRSYLIERQKCNANVKRNSGGYSASSTDSLDYMSSVSSSSKGSNKMLNMAEVDAIVMQQEQSLQQVMSTPKPLLNRGTKLWENNGISPIAPLDLGRGDHLSDSDSNDDYRTIGSDSSNMPTPYGSDVQTNSTRMQENYYSAKSSREGSRPVTSPKKTQRDFKQSYSNLKTFDNNLKSSYGNLRHASSQIKGSYSNIASSNLKGSYSNLKFISSDLRSSYTQLRPVLTNLPETKRFKQPIVSKQKNVSDDLKIAEVAPTLRDFAPMNQVKPLSAVGSTARPVKSSLPRPVSCIPRPTQSRIPAPQLTRPSSYSRLTRPVSKHFNGDF